MIAGFKTWLPLKKENSEKTRIVLLMKLDKPEMKLREDLMSPNFPSIWVEEEIELGKISSGFPTKLMRNHVAMILQCLTLVLWG